MFFFPQFPQTTHVYPCVSMCYVWIGFFTTIGKQRLIYGLTGGDGLEDGALAVAGECRISCWQVRRVSLGGAGAFRSFGVFPRQNCCN